MHWSEKLADEIIARNPNKTEYVCAAGISPSGSVHIGNFRDIATPYYVVKTLKNAGALTSVKTNTSQFAMGPTGETSLYGGVKNPQQPRKEQEEHRCDGYFS